MPDSFCCIEREIPYICPNIKEGVSLYLDGHAKNKCIPVQKSNRYIQTLRYIFGSMTMGMFIVTSTG